ncbi:MAG: hypothetical protein EAZ57_02380 [Cytophagales bacterium]|nr:MAG: hypothetical protein EAZ67_02205 [Cytophagales bacterium]TAF61964.1 MAG: hypothetical protein EAZ57_02380 [Cytophagales bacterium]
MQNSRRKFITKTLVAAFGLSLTNPISLLASTCDHDFRKLAESLFWKIRNAKKLNQETRELLISKIAAYEKRMSEEQVPSGLRLPLSLVYYTPKAHEINLIKGYKPIAYLPNVDLLYHIVLEYHQRCQAEQQKDRPQFHRIPTPEVVMGILCRESYFCTDVIGDGGQSIGMCQLYFPTAKYLLQTPKYKDVFSKCIYLYKNTEGQLRHGIIGYTKDEVVRNTVCFVYDFLRYGQEFKADQAFTAIRRYQGGSHKYARSVIRNMTKYRLFISQELKAEISYEDWLHNQRHLYFCSPRTQETFDLKENEELNTIFKATSHAAATETLYAERGAIDNGLLLDGESMANFQKSSFESISFDYTGFHFYLIKSPNRSLYAYFQENLYDAVQYHNTCASTQEHIMLYCTELHDKVPTQINITSKEQLQSKLSQQEVVSTNARAYQKIYINPELGVYMKKDEDLDYQIFTEKIIRSGKNR